MGTIFESQVQYISSFNATGKMLQFEQNLDSHPPGQGEKNKEMEGRQGWDS